MGGGREGRGGREKKHTHTHTHWRREAEKRGRREGSKGVSPPSRHQPRPESKEKQVSPRSPPEKAESAPPLDSSLHPLCLISHKEEGKGRSETNYWKNKEMGGEGGRELGREGGREGRKEKREDHEVCRGNKKEV